MKRKRIIITGASGFIGRALTPLLAKSGYEICAFGRTKPPGKERIRYYKGDLLVSGSLRNAFARVDAVVHLASIVNVNYSLQHPAEVISANLTMLLNILEEARRNNLKPLIVFASTDRLYGKTKKRTVNETEPPYPIEPYTASKMLCEIVLENYWVVYGIPYIVLRLDSVYGPAQPSRMFIPDIIRKIYSEDEIRIGDLSVYKNFVYVEDVAEAFVCALRAPRRAYNAAYNISGAHASLHDIVKRVTNFFWKKMKKKVAFRFDLSLVRQSGFEVSPFRLSTQKARRALNWRPRTDLDVGLRKTALWFLQYDRKFKKN
jgi:nucleoside-diphosphate-sugar epimerase